MSSWVRVWKQFDTEAIKPYLLVMGDLSAECFNCRAVGLKRDVLSCPECKTNFKYIAFRRKQQIRPVEGYKDQIIFIDFEDFLSEYKRGEAKRFLEG